MGYLDVSPEIGMRHMEGPKNPDGLNLGIHIFVYVYKVHMCIYMPRGGMRSWTNCFFLLTCLFFKKSRRCDDNQQTTVTHFGENKRLHLESSKQNYYIISFWAIIKAIFTSLGYLMWAQVWDRHMEGQKYPDRLKRSIHIDRIGVHSTFVYIYAVLQVLMIWANYFFLLTCQFFLEK